MSIKEDTKRASRKSLKEKPSAPQYVVPETAIREFVEKLGIFDIEAAATRLQTVADATRKIVDKPIRQLDPADLRLISLMATQSKNKRYQRIMKAIIESVGQGPEGIKAAHLTARLAVEMAFRWTRDYASAFREFEARLRESRATGQARDSATQGRLLRVVSSSE